MAKKILFVEDEVDLVKVVAFRLEKAGYEVCTAFNGQEALSFLEKDTPDLILLDLILPGVSGYDICKKVKLDPELKKIPVVLFTASAVHIQDALKETGADDYVIKPFDAESLLAKIKGLIA